MGENNAPLLFLLGEALGSGVPVVRRPLGLELGRVLDHDGRQGQTIAMVLRIVDHAATTASPVRAARRAARLRVPTSLGLRAGFPHGAHAFQRLGQVVGPHLPVRGAFVAADPTVRRAGWGADEEGFLALGRVQEAVRGFFRGRVFPVVDSAVVHRFERRAADVEGRGEGGWDAVVDYDYPPQRFYRAEGV